MADWFAPKRYGYGAGVPVSWQGWALTIGFLVVALGSALLFQSKPLLVVAILVPAVLLFTLIAARTTRGGWHWRWGDKD
jgi:hypothetical protein